MKKKWIIGLMVISMVLFLVGCGNSSNNVGGKTSVIDGGAGESATALSYWTFVELHGQHFEKILTIWNVANPDRQIKLKL